MKKLGMVVVFLFTSLSYGSLVAQWKFDESIGNVAYDSINSNDGIIYGASRKISPLDKSLDFDGVDDYVCIDNFDYSVFATNQLTIEAKFKIDVPGGVDFPQHYILDSRDGSKEAGFGINVDTELIQFWIGDFAVDFPSTIQCNTWHHLIGTFDGLNYSVYLNNVLMGKIYRPDNIIESISPMFIGQRYTFDERFNGEIDEVRIYNNSIPEPTSLVLFSLGGLFFLRKKS